MELLIATGNQHKIHEISLLLADIPVTIKTLVDFPLLCLTPETGDSFHANAAIKAEAASKETGLLTLADDSGLEVDALHGAPGVYSARFAGNGHDDAANNDKLLKLLKGVPEAERSARFRCSIALAEPGKQTVFFDGICEGFIALSLQGNGGFGYDPLLYLPQLGKTVAQLTETEKNSLSHRAKALQKAKVYLRELMRY